MTSCAQDAGGSAGSPSRRGRQQQAPSAALQPQQQQQEAGPQPTDVEVIEFARKALGLDPIADAELLHLARYVRIAFWLVE